jgi:hypothetical protein
VAHLKNSNRTALKKLELNKKYNSTQCRTINNTIYPTTYLDEIIHFLVESLDFPSFMVSADNAKPELKSATGPPQGIIYPARVLVHNEWS